ncbi:MAG: flagellar export protein FliJ [Gracilibacteraceae bacterium]|jgi:flagellar FliJ protein|nr:flagellar export protein FliJ [Gracilibacteraceae bacterium]
MAFKFRLEASLRFAEQKMESAQGVLSQELRVLHSVQKEYNKEVKVLEKAFDRQAEEALRNPRNLNAWKLFIETQKEKIRLIAERLAFQEAVVAECREAVKACRIEVEKYKRLKEKKWKEFIVAEQKKEQALLDEIGQKIGR